MFYFKPLKINIINSINISGVSIVENKNKFTVTPKQSIKAITLTLRISEEMNNKLEELSRISNRSRNELINKALEFAFENLEFTDINKK